MLFGQDFQCEAQAEQLNRIDEAFEAIVSERQSGEVGYYSLPLDSLQSIEAAEQLNQENTLLQSGNITDIAVIGIGGSSLGIKAIDSLLKYNDTHKRKLHFFENTDPKNITAIMAELKRESTLFIVISKSGTTIETTSIFKAVIVDFDLDLDGDDRERVLIITDEGSALSQFAAHHGLTQFAIPHNVGGRFSVLSAVGVVPLMLAGYDTRMLLEGAQHFLSRFFQRQEDHLLQKACFLVEHHDSHNTNVMFAYANELEDMSKWYVQLWGESLGKINAEGKSVGLTPMALIGSVDQHSFLQLLMEGPKNKTVTFVNIKDFGNNLTIPDISLEHIEKTDFVNGSTFSALINRQSDATRESLIQNGVPTDTLVIEKFNEHNIGTMIIYFELLTSVVGAMLNVNTYDQPGVEFGKKILYEKFDEK